MAEGKLDLVIYPQIDVWDYAAGVLICKESGVLVTGIRGEEEIHNCKSILAAREILHKEILLKLD